LRPPNCGTILSLSAIICRLIKCISGVEEEGPPTGKIAETGGKAGSKTDRRTT
jgi:hypothetical protein